MGVRQGLQSIPPAHRRSATLAARLQLAPTSRQPGRTAPSLQTRPQQKQPAETPQIAHRRSLEQRMRTSAAALTMVLFTSLGTAAIAVSAAAPQALPPDNPFAAASTLPYELPPFD